MRNLVLQYEFSKFLALDQESHPATVRRCAQFANSSDWLNGSVGQLGGTHMDAEPVRWMMMGRGEPLVQVKMEGFSLAPDEVLIEIAGCGVCHTDLGYYYDGVRTKHDLPLTLGHEISGHVVDSGADSLFWTDRAVIVPAVIPCGHCDVCRRGKATICPNQKMPGNDIHGGFATHIVVPAYGVCDVDEHRLRAARIDLA